MWINSQSNNVEENGYSNFKYKSELIKREYDILNRFWLIKYSIQMRNWDKNFYKRFSENMNFHYMEYWNPPDENLFNWMWIINKDLIKTKLGIVSTFLNENNYYPQKEIIQKCFQDAFWEYSEYIPFINDFFHNLGNLIESVYIFKKYVKKYWENWSKKYEELKEDAILVWKEINWYVINYWQEIKQRLISSWKTIDEARYIIKEKSEYSIKLLIEKVQYKME